MSDREIDNTRRPWELTSADYPPEADEFPPATRRELWTTAQAAEHCEVKPVTYRYYRKRLGAPDPVSGQSGRGQDLYDAAAVREWQANRAGQGARTDLRDEHDVD